MNKAVNRRALAVYLVICLLYVSVAFRVPEKLSMKRITTASDVTTRGMNVNRRGSAGLARAESRAGVTTQDRVANSASVPEASSAPAPTPVRAASSVDGSKSPENRSPLTTAEANSRVEPRFFISIPITCHAIKAGWLDQETLIFSKKNGQSSVWLKPLDILKQQDEDGVKHLITIIGKSRLKEFLISEAVDIREEMSPEDIILGKGYTIEKRKLLSLYDRYVREECNELFPLMLAEGGVVKGKQGFRFVSSGEAARTRTEKAEEEWRMPNLTGLPIKLAIDSLAVHTSKIKVHGSGFVVDQSPKPFEMLADDSECAIYGRLASE